MADLEFHVPTLGELGNIPEKEIPIQGLRLCQNMMRGVDGALMIRPGSAILGSALGDRIMGISGFRTAAAADRVVAATLTTLKYWDGTTWNAKTGATTPSGGNSNHWRFTTMSVSGTYKIIGTNAVNNTQIWDGGAGTFADQGGAFGVSIATAVAANRLLMLQSPDIVKISEFNNPESNPAFTARLIDYGDLMIGMQGLSKTRVAVLGEGSQWVAIATTGSFPFRFEPLGTFPGPLSSACPVRYGADVYWLATDYTAYRFNGFQEPVEVGRAMQNFVKANIDIANRNLSHGSYFPEIRKIIWFFCGSGSSPVMPNLGIFYDVQTGEMGRVAYAQGVSASGTVRITSGTTWDSLTAYTWDNLAAAYPTWDSFGSLTSDSRGLIGTGLTGKAEVVDSGPGTDNGYAVNGVWETPLLPYAGWPNNTVPDTFETFFKKASTECNIKLSVGKTDTLADTPTYVADTIFDISIDSRKDIDLSSVGEARFITIRHEVLGNGRPVKWLGGLFKYEKAGVEKGPMGV